MKIVKSILFIAVIFLSSSAFAQKFGHINSNELLMLMPERNQVESEIKAYASELEAQLSAMTKEYQTKVSDFQAKEASMTDMIRKSKINEITDLEARIQEFQSGAQQDLQKKEETLLKPIIDKAKKAIEDVAKENNYTYIFDSGVGVLLYHKDSENIMPMVKKKMGLL